MTCSRRSNRTKRSWKRSRPYKITRLIVGHAMVATVNSHFELTVGLSAPEKPTVRKALTVATHATGHGLRALFCVANLGVRSEKTGIPIFF